MAFAAPIRAHSSFEDTLELPDDSYEMIHIQLLTLIPRKGKSEKNRPISSKHSLLILPLDILSEIAALLNLNNLGRLKLTGSVDLWQRIQTCLKRAIHDPPVCPFSRLSAEPLTKNPFLLLSGFNHLETVTLSHVFWIQPSDEPSYITSLPLTLRHLTYDTKQVCVAFPPPLLRLPWHLAFPSLESLRVKFLKYRCEDPEDDNIAGWLKTLPKTLKVLSLLECARDSSQLCTSLFVSSSDPILPLLEVLECDCSSSKWLPPFSNTPPNLRVFRTSIADRLRKLPDWSSDPNPGLREIHLHGINNFPDKWIESFPSDIKIFKVRVGFLHDANIMADLIRFKTLTKLFIRKIESTNVVSLPPTLTSLSTSSYNATAISQCLQSLPHIAKLKLDGGDPRQIDFPPNITKLKLVLYSEEVLNSIPERVTYLDLPSMSIKDSRLHILPRCLKHLKVLLIASSNRGSNEVLLAGLPQTIESLFIEGLVQFMAPLPPSLKFCQFNNFILPLAPKKTLWQMMMKGSVAVTEQTVAEENAKEFEAALQHQLCLIPPHCHCVLRLVRDGKAVRMATLTKLSQQPPRDWMKVLGVAELITY
jgi:hypothetical protein